MKHTLATYPARQYSTRNRRRRSRLKRAALILVIAAALTAFWVGAGYLVTVLLLNL